MWRSFLLRANSAGLLSFSLLLSFKRHTLRCEDAGHAAEMLAHIWILLPSFLSSFPFVSFSGFVRSSYRAESGGFEHYMYYGWAKRIVYAVTGTSHWRSFCGGVQRTALCRRMRICRPVLGKQRLSSLLKCNSPFRVICLLLISGFDIIAVIVF